MSKFLTLKEKIIIVTGATGILGEAFVNGLSEEKAKVVLIGRNEPKENTSGINTLFV